MVPKVPRYLPVVSSLAQAVRAVITSNTEDGYPPVRFIQITANGDVPDLLTVCDRLINKAEVLDYIEKGIREHGSLLSLEDFVVKYGASWGFNPETIKIADARVKLFDLWAGFTRYVDDV